MRNFRFDFDCIFFMNIKSGINLTKKMVAIRPNIYNTAGKGRVSNEFVEDRVVGVKLARDGPRSVTPALLCHAMLMSDSLPKLLHV